MQKIKVGIVGCGSITQQRHAPEYHENARAEIGGFYDVNPQRATALCAAYGGTAYDTFEDMLADPTVQAISICSPNDTHCDWTVRALRAGKHVLCEKPMAQSLQESRIMTAAQKESGKVLMIGHNQRMVAAHQKARELLLSGAIGKVLFLQSNFKHAGPEHWSIDRTPSTWFFSKQQAGFGVLGDLGAHKLDLIRFLTGKEIKTVFATMMTLDKHTPEGELISLEDNAVCQFFLDGGLPGIIHVSWTNYGCEDNSTFIYGKTGVMKIFSGYADDIVLEMRDGSTAKYNVGAISTNAKQVRSGIIDEFIASILENRSPIVTGSDGHNTLAVIVSAMESYKQGRWLEVEY